MISYTMQDPAKLCDHVRKVEAKLKGCKGCAKCDGELWGKYVCNLGKAPDPETGYCRDRDEERKV